MLAYASWHVLKCGDMHTIGSPEATRNAYDKFRIAASRCLTTDNYTAPGRWKIEALMLYFGMEYYRRADRDTAPVSTSFLWAGIMRLALLMGYHRDPRHFPGISPFEGEMRRRTWALVLECDTIISFLFGLPISISQRFTDTELPSNLADEDLAEDMLQLPASRPDTEMTRVLYQITMTRIISIFADILDAITVQGGTSYTRVLELDIALADSEERSQPSFALFR